MIKPNNVQDLINLILNNKKIYDIVQVIYIQDTFFFTYNICEKAEIEENYQNPRHNIDNFKARAKLAIEFQINFRNFKTNKKINTVKA